jgi:2-(1,2-epoxy-1,2-dihydrophenyl)acetyl-CoA isomerase
MIRYEVTENVALVTIDRVDKLNSLTLSMRERLRDSFAKASADESVRAVLLRAEGSKAFCAGADIAELDGNDTRRDFLEITNPLIINLYRIPKPVVCAVQGVAVGMGWSLALASDIVVAGRSSRFSQIFRNVGLVHDAGASWFLTRAVGVAVAKELVFSARWVSAEEALRFGLVQQIVDDVDLPERAMSLARDLAAGPTLAYAGAKRLFDHATMPTLEQHLELESELQIQLAGSKDHKAALVSFIDKSKPVFRGE